MTEKTLKEHLEEHPDKVVVICNKLEKAEDLQLNRNKFLIDKDCPIARLNAEIRNQLKQKTKMSNKSIILFYKNTVFSGNTSIGEIFQKHNINVNEPLYIEYCTENTFG